MPLPPATTITIGGSAIAPAETPPVRLTVFHRGGVPSLAIQRRGGPLAGLPDPWLGKSITLAIGGTTCFAGDVASASPGWDDRLGWVTVYQCLGLRNRGDYIPFTNDNNGLDRLGFNLQPDDPAYIAALAGRTVGQVLTAVLTTQTNSGNLNAYGLGAYTALGPPAVLPAATIADLAALTLIPPTPVSVGGEKLLSAVEAFLDEWAPNHFLWCDPATGALRVLDMRAFAAHTFTLGTDPIDPSGLARDVGDSFQRVLVRGQPWVEPWLLSTANGGLAESFAHDGLTSAAAKAAWTPSNFSKPGAAQDAGTCTCPSTATVTVTSSSATNSWGANFWDQTGAGAHGILTLAYPAGSGLTQYATRRIVANTALAAGGTSTLTLDMALPVTSYTTYAIFGLAAGASVVWRKYAASNASVGAALQNTFPYPVPYVNAANSATALTSVPTGSVVYGSAAPYNEFPLSFVQDPTTGTFLFSAPTYRIAGNTVPVDVRVLAAVATGANQVAAPADVAGVKQYAGTGHSVEALTRTLVVTVDGWRDPLNAAAMATYAADLLDSVKDAIVEGEVVYNGLYTPALVPGIALNVTGSTYTTGWETPLTSFTGGGLPVVAVTLDWPGQGATDFITTMHCSNRRQHYGQGAFLRPSRTGIEIGTHDDSIMIAGIIPGLGPKAYGDVQFGTAGGGVKAQDMEPGSSVDSQLGLNTGVTTGAGDMSQALNDAAISPDMSDVPTSPADVLGTDKSDNGMNHDFRDRDFRNRDWDGG